MSVQIPGTQIRPTQELLDGAIAAATAALGQLPAAELLASTGAGVGVVDSPAAATLVLLSLGESKGLWHELVVSCVERLRASRASTGLWRFSPDAAAPATGESARALVALRQWNVTLDAPSSLEALLSRDGVTAGEDVATNADLLLLAAHEGRALPERAAWVSEQLRARGLLGCAGGQPAASPFLLGYLLTRWVRGAGDHWQLAVPLRNELITLWEKGEVRGAVNVALAMSALMNLGRPTDVNLFERTLDAMASLLLKSQSEEGLWPVAPLYEAGEVVYGSLEASAALCVEALARYVRIARIAADRTDNFLPGALPARSGTWKETLAAFDKDYPPALFAPEARERLLALGEWLPAALEGDGGFEVRLLEGTPRVDFILGIKHDGQALLAGEHPHASLPAPLFDAPEWRRIRDFARGWSEPDGLLDREVDAFWLEFDLDAPVASPPLPIVFLCTRDQPVAVSEALHRQKSETYRATLHAGLPLLRGDDAPLTPELQREMDVCINALPPGAHLYAACVMMSRRSKNLRFTLKNVPPERIVSYLEAVAWPGDFQQLRDTLAWVLPLGVNRFMLNLDLSPRLLPTLGLECSFQGRAQPAEEPRWQLLLDALVTRGLCAPARRDALLAWPGRTQIQLPAGSAVRESVFDKRLAHVKLGLTGAPLIEAKAYLATHRTSETLRAR
ncbi:hypothetical protein [Corallococcus macrosporus]|uniref:Uncharacterized protein n=1 Tax=Myxococcus fulvus (strain ATCC BAA-855 / HW-1) TaxID=483219 RepID=F8CF67_MYXFH|nr:hypothetical protein [Corallococcus macrosporus]AEI68655.1 hypothetical protein LILAB_33870 [Corallococcus macrosporus]